MDKGKYWTLTNIVVLDTGVLYAAPQAFELQELQELGPVDFVVPAAVL